MGGGGGGGAGKKVCAGCPWCTSCDRPVLPMSHPFWSLPGVTSHHMGGGGGVALCSQARVKSNISASTGNISLACLHLLLFIYII